MRARNGLSIGGALLITPVSGGVLPRSMSRASRSGRFCRLIVGDEGLSEPQVADGTQVVVGWVGQQLEELPPVSVWVLELDIPFAPWCISRAGSDQATRGPAPVGH